MDGRPAVSVVCAVAGEVVSVSSVLVATDADVVAIFFAPIATSGDLEISLVTKYVPPPIAMVPMSIEMSTGICMNPR